MLSLNMNYNLFKCCITCIIRVLIHVIKKDFSIKFVFDVYFKDITIKLIFVVFFSLYIVIIFCCKIMIIMYKINVGILFKHLVRLVNLYFTIMQFSCD